MNLTVKQIRFCDEYLIDLNGKQAAIRAGYTPKTAEVQASRLLSYAKVKEYLSKSKERLANKLEISQEMVLEGYRKLAFFDIRKFYGENNELLDVKSLDDETSFALSGIEVTEEKTMNIVTGYTKKIKTSDRRAALDSICKVLGYNAAEIHQVKTEISNPAFDNLSFDELYQLKYGNKP